MIQQISTSKSLISLLLFQLKLNGDKIVKDKITLIYV